MRRGEDGLDFLVVSSSSSSGMLHVKHNFQERFLYMASLTLLSAFKYSEALWSARLIKEAALASNIANISGQHFGSHCQFKVERAQRPLQ